jgi:hypothetical protein
MLLFAILLFVLAVVGTFFPHGLIRAAVMAVGAIQLALVVLILAAHDTDAFQGRVSSPPAWLLQLPVWFLKGLVLGMAWGIFIGIYTGVFWWFARGLAVSRGRLLMTGVAGAAVAFLLAPWFDLFWVCSLGIDCL